jgi:hypothetical protein
MDGHTCPHKIDLIAQITGLPSQGMDLTLILDDKSKEKALVEEMKKKYDTMRGDKRHYNQTYQKPSHTIRSKDLSL